MDVLVTGGGGFLGSAICRELAGRGHRVIAYQRSPAEHLARFGVESVSGDIGDRERLTAAAAGCDAIIHTAAKAGIWGDPADYRRINIDGTRSVVAACRAGGIGLLVHTSSPSIVHTGGDIEGGDESLPLATRFSAPYPETKAAAERRVLAANGDNLKTCALRPHLIWGPGDPHILPRLAARARGGRLALPAPHKVIDTVFVDNAALAHVKALQELAGRGRCAGKAYFVTNNEPLPQGEIVRRLLAALGMDVTIRAVPAGLALTAGAVAEWAWRFFRIQGEPPATRFSVEQLATAHWFDTSAAVRDFGYLPTVSIEEGLAILSEQGL
ncbi:MAG: NAD-dependent epimerase/dehydratase family protein [Xanthomonadales bacterium]